METFNLSKYTLELLSPADIEFFRRIWKTPISVYENRLKAIGFTYLANVLDAGCGFGQWSLALSKHNAEVFSFDYSEGRISALKDVIACWDIKNIYTSVQSIDNINFENSKFDAVFCYGVIMFSDHRLALKELHRVLKPGGKLYVCTNGLGWYLHNLIDTHNSSENFDSREMAIQTLENTFDFFYTGTKSSIGQLCIPSHILKKEMENVGFRIVASGAEGTINLSDISINPFFKGEYYGREGVYEILAERLNND